MKNRPQDRGCARGFSLVEALVVLALLGLLLGLATQGIGAVRARQSLQALAEDLWNSLMLARSQALVQQQRVVLCPRTAVQGCDALGQWSQGWLVFVDDNLDGQRASGERVLQSRGPLPAGMQLQGNRTVGMRVAYGTDGRSDSLGGTFTVCSAGQPQAWRVVVNALGRPRMEKFEALSCP